MEPLRFGAKGSDVERWQTELCEHGYACTVDGVFGPQTHNATLAVQTAAGLPITGVVTETERRALGALVVPTVATELPEVTRLRGIAFVQSRWFTMAHRKTIDLIVLHCMECPEASTTAESCARYLGRLPDSEAKRSCHYFVDCDSIVQGVHDTDIAWHAPGVNHNAIGIEHAGYSRQSEREWLDDFGRRMLALSAELVAGKCQQWSIPVKFIDAEGLAVNRRGITTHAEVTRAFPKQSHGHTDPGPGFPMTLYLQRVQSTMDRLGRGVGERD